MDTKTKIKMLRENAARFRARADVDRPNRQALLRSYHAALKRAHDLEKNQ